MYRNPNLRTMYVFEALFTMVVVLVLSVLVLVLFGVRAHGAEFVVVADRTTHAAPALVVVDRTEKTPVVDDAPTDLSKPAPAGWEKVSVNGGPWHFRRVADAPKTLVPAPGGARDPHACPSCNRYQYTVDGFNRDGTHRHRCPVDGTVWSH